MSTYLSWSEYQRFGFSARWCGESSRDPGETSFPDHLPPTVNLQVNTIQLLILVKVPGLKSYTKTRAVTLHDLIRVTLVNRRHTYIKSL